MGSIEGLAGVVRDANTTIGEYAATQGRTANKITELAQRQYQIGALIGQLAGLLGECDDLLKKQVTQHPHVARILQEATFNLECATLDTSDEELRSAVGALVGVANSSDDFGTMLATMSDTVGMQRRYTAELAEGLQTSFETTRCMAEQASRHASEASEAAIALGHYTDRITGAG